MTAPTNSLRLSYVITPENLRNQLVLSYSLINTLKTIVVVAGDKQKDFFQRAIVNLEKWGKGLELITWHQLESQSVQKHKAHIIILDPPYDTSLIPTLIEGCPRTTLFLLNPFKKYLNLLRKKLPEVTLQLLNFSDSSVAGALPSLEKFVGLSYDFNRSAFGAYGECLRWIEKHPMKRIFRTQLINVDELAKGFGFPAAQRVNEGQFLTDKARKRIKAEKRKLKGQIKEVTLEGEENTAAKPLDTKKAPKTGKKLQKVSIMKVAPKTKKIRKTV